MNLISLTSRDFKRISSLLERREKLQGQLEALDQALAAYEGGSTAASAPPAVVARPPTKARSRRRRLKLKEKIVGLLEAAGRGGLTVSQLAEEIGVKPDRIYSWFHATGPKVRKIKKLGKAHYAWVG